ITLAIIIITFVISAGESMQAAIEAIVIRGGVPRRPHLSNALATAGWSVRDCPAIGRLGDLAEARPPQVLVLDGPANALRSEEHTSELQSLLRISYAVFCL